MNAGAGTQDDLRAGDLRAVFIVTVPLIAPAPCASALAAMLKVKIIAIVMTS